MPWQSKTFRAWKRFLDETHRQGRRNTQGKQPRHRDYNPLGQHTSNRPPPRGLPVNCYDAEWLSKLHPKELEELRVGPISEDLETFVSLYAFEFL